MKKNAVTVILVGTLTFLATWGKLYAADDPMASAGILSVDAKPIAPGFSLTDVQDEQVVLENLRGKVVLLFFWTTW